MLVRCCNISYATGQLVFGQWIKGSEEAATFKAVSGYLAAAELELKRRCEEAAEEECDLLKQGAEGYLLDIGSIGIMRKKTCA